MDAFIGNIDAKIDEKGRAFVPASFRKILQTAGEGRLILRKNVFKDCLVLSPESVWKEELAKVQERLNEYDEDDEDFYRQFSRVEILEIDSTGRILIPKKYLNVAHISNTVCFFGMTKTIEMWNPEQLNKSMLSPEDFKNKVKKLLGSKPAANEKSAE